MFSGNGNKIIILVSNSGNKLYISVAKKWQQNIYFSS